MTLHVTLTDFGLAMLMNQTSSIGTKTMLAGSPGYQSPEQLRAECIGPASDVYAFGAVVFVTFTEGPLWPGLGHYQIMVKVTANQKPNIEGLPSSLQDICRRCFSEHKSRPSINCVLNNIQQVINDQ